MRWFPLVVLTMIACSTERPPSLANLDEGNAYQAVRGEENDASGQACIVLSDGEPMMMCTQQYEPVCGCDGKTYGNACMAALAGVQRHEPGPCQDDSPTSL